MIVNKQVNPDARLSKNFRRNEFACKCGCGFDDVDPELVYILQAVRGYFDQPVTITSACRCPKHNMTAGGSENSQHLLGTAADIVVSGVPSSEVIAYLELARDLLNQFHAELIGYYMGCALLADEPRELLQLRVNLCLNLLF